MSDSPDAPNWNLLPHSPQEFFGLADNFDRKDLKRGYNRLIRVFKPEKFPQEFQRIRAAYEQLDNQLRYGAQFSQAQEIGPSYEWVTDVKPGKEKSASQSTEKTSTPRRLPLHERIQQEPLVDVYRGISKKADKSAYDYYALAVMSDVVHRKDGLQFVRWILAGIQALPNERGLFSLLYEYLRSPISSSDIPRLLFACAQIIPDDRYYAMTESLWLRMLRESPFHDFRTTLEKCEAQLKGIGIDGRLAFSIEILKTAIWKADSQWIDNIMMLIDENHERIPFHLHYDIDLLEFLRRYIDLRDEFIKAHPLRRKIDGAIQAYFSQDQQAGDQSVLDAQIAIAQNASSLIEAFPYANEEDHDSLFMVWSVISEDVAERNVAPLEKEEDLGVWSSRVQALLQRTNAAANASTYVFRWKVANLVYLGVILAMYFILIVVMAFGLMFLTLEVESDGLTLLLVLGVSIGFGGYLSRRIHVRFLAPIWERYCLKKSTYCYRKIWRQKILEFIDRSHLSYFDLRELFLQCNIYGLSHADWTIGHYQQDYALAFYSTSRRFVV